MNMFSDLTPLMLDNVDELAARLRELLVDKRLVIFKAEHIDSNSPSFRVDTDARIQSDWTDGSKEQIRVQKKGDIYTPTGQWAKDGPREVTHPSLGFSMGNYFHTYTVCEDPKEVEYKTDGQHFRVPHFRIVDRDRDGTRVEIRDMAPAGVGYLHHYIICPIGSLDVYEELKEAQRQVRRSKELVSDYERDKKAIADLLGFVWNIRLYWLR